MDIIEGFYGGRTSISQDVTVVVDEKDGASHRQYQGAATVHPT